VRELAIWEYKSETVAAELSALYSANKGYSPNHIHSFEEAQQILEQNEALSVVLLYTSPIQVITHAIEEGSNMASALLAWHEAATDFQRLLQSYRQRIIVLPQDAFVSHPAAAYACLGLSEAKWNPGIGHNSKPAPSLLTLVAEKLLAAEPKSAALAAALNACSSVDVETPFTADELLDAYDAHSQAVQQSQAAEVQTVQLRDKLADTQSELKKLEALQHQTEISCRFLGDQNRAVIQTLGHTEQQLADAISAKRIVDAALSALKKDKQTLQTDHDTLAEAHANLETELERIWQSSSMRLTAPLRYLRCIFGKRSGD